jgi:hypothetical protein
VHDVASNIQEEIAYQSRLTGKVKTQHNIREITPISSFVLLGDNERGDRKDSSFGGTPRLGDTIDQLKELVKSSILQACPLKVKLDEMLRQAE